MKMLVETNNFLLVIIHSLQNALHLFLFFLIVEGRQRNFTWMFFYRDQELKRLSFKLDEAQEVTYSAFLS